MVGAARPSGGRPAARATAFPSTEAKRQPAQRGRMGFAVLQRQRLNRRNSSAAAVDRRVTTADTRSQLRRIYPSFDA